jgi:hypothetical protein
MFILQRSFISRVILSLVCLLTIVGATLVATTGTATAAPSRPAAKTVKASPAVIESCGAATPEKITRDAYVGAPPFSVVHLWLTVHVCYDGVLVWAPWDISPDGDYSIPCSPGHSNFLTPGEPRTFNEAISNCILYGVGTDEKELSLLWLYDLATQTPEGLPGETYEMWFVVSGSGQVTASGTNLFCVADPDPEVCTAPPE